METWRPIAGDYEISSYGRVKNAKTYNIMKTFITNKRIEGIRLTINGHKIGYTIHRLVAMAFLPQKDGKNVVNHIDGNSLNNHVDNLEWCTQTENIYHSKNITKNGAVISVQKIRQLYDDNPSLSLSSFVELLIKNSR